MFKGGQSMWRRLYISSAFAASRRPPHDAESERAGGRARERERATGGFTQECVITVAGGHDPSGRPEEQPDRRKQPLATERCHGDGGVKNNSGSRSAASGASISVPC